MGVSVAIGVGIGAVVGGGAAAIQSGGDFNAIWKGALVGAVGGAVGGWAAPALTGALGGTLGGMAAGGLGGVTAGVLGTALNGGNASDYLKNGLFGGLGGAVTGGLTGSLGGLGGEGGLTGSEATVNPVTGEAVPVGEPTITPLPEGDVTSGLGGSNINGTAAIDATVTGNPATTTPQPAVTSPLQDAGIGGNQYAAANTGTMTDIGGSSAIPQELPGGYSQPEVGQSSSLLDTLGSQGQTSANTSMKSLGLGSLGEGTSSPFAPNQSTASQYSLGGNDYGVTTNTGDVLNSAGEKLGKAPGWEMPGQTTVRGTANVTPQNSGFDFGDFLSKTGQGLAGKMLTAGNLLKGAGAISGYGEAQQNRQQLMDLYNAQRNQYNTQNAAANQYQQQLQNTYANPNDYLNSPEAAAAREAAMQKLLAQNAAAGRRTSGLAMQNQLMMNQLSNLANYRQGLSNAARGTYASPTGLSQTLGGAQAQSPQGNLYAGLGSIFAPAPNYVVLR